MDYVSDRPGAVRTNNVYVYSFKFCWISISFLMWIIYVQIAFGLLISIHSVYEQSL